MSVAVSGVEWEHQNAQYAFPYHYTPHFEAGVPRVVRSLGWGLEYLCYMRHIAEMVHELSPVSVLDVGCGDGRLLSDLSFVPRRVGVDLSSEAIGFAKAFAPPVEFHNIDVAHLSESFDLVTSVEVLEHVPDEFITEFLRNIGARVREGGHLLVSVPTTARPKHVKHYRHYTECMLREALAETLPHFEIVSAEHIFADTWLTSLYQKLTINRLWTLEAPALSRLIWSKVWASRRSTPGRGAHLVALLRRC